MNFGRTSKHLNPTITTISFKSCPFSRELFNLHPDQPRIKTIPAFLLDVSQAYSQRITSFDQSPKHKKNNNQRPVLKAKQKLRSNIFNHSPRKSIRRGQSPFSIPIFRRPSHITYLPSFSYPHPFLNLIITSPPPTPSPAKVVSLAKGMIAR